MKKLFITFVTTVFCFSGVLKAQRTGGVCISDTLAEAHESAILQLASGKKGVVLPVMSIEERDRIRPLAIGLTVFVKDNNMSGFQYWNGSDWIGLAVINDRKPSMIAPLGGIIMYHGSFDNFDENGRGLPGTEMEGWQLCNGNFNTPDLSSRFIVGGGLEEDLTSDVGNDPLYTRVGPKYQTVANTYTIKTENMPPHTHQVDETETITFDHEHMLTSENNYGLIDETTIPGQHSHTFYTKSDGKRTSGELSRKSIKKEKNMETENVPEEINLNEIKIGWAKKSDGSVPKVSYTVNDNVMNQNDGERVVFDRRPKYYVLAFIIRIDDNYPDSYGGEHPINYNVQ